MIFDSCLPQDRVTILLQNAFTSMSPVVKVILSHVI